MPPPPFNAFLMRKTVLSMRIVYRLCGGQVRYCRSTRGVIDGRRAVLKIAFNYSVDGGHYQQDAHQPRHSQYGCNLSVSFCPFCPYERRRFQTHHAPAMIANGSSTHRMGNSTA